jgi:predicted RNA-binding protein YlxR (DUF448 family)
VERSEWRRGFLMEDVSDIAFVRREGDYVICEKDGFVFRVHRSSYPVNKVSPSQCTTPNEYYKFLTRKIHGERYDLSKVNFTGSDNKVVVQCYTHGEFVISAKDLTRGQGCKRCGHSRTAEILKSNTPAFIEKARLVHGDKYDYSLSEYSTSNELLAVLCKEHGEFNTRPSNHLSGKGCYLCGYESSATQRKLTREEVLRRFAAVHKDKYDYSNTEYKDAHALLRITCKTHGEFNQSYANHNSGQGCPVCAKEYNPFLKSGFMKSYSDKQYASLYLIRCFNSVEVFYKIGITTKPLKRRFAGKEAMPYSYELLHLHIGEAADIWEAEKVLQCKYADLRYNPQIWFGGGTECFSYIDASDFKAVLGEIVTPLATE